MKFTYHPFSSVIVAVAVWLSLVPLSPLLADTGTILTHSWFILGTSAAVGLLLALLRAPRALILLSQLVAILGVLAWRGLSMAPPGDRVESLRFLTADGIRSIREGIPPVPLEPGLLWLCLVFTALLVIVVELLVNGLEQPAWTIAPLALTYGVAALVVTEDLDWTLLVPVLVGYVAVLLSTTDIGSSAGKASRAGSHHLSRVSVGVAGGAAALALAILVSSVVPLGDKQPWNEGGSSGPIQLADPTVRLDEDLRRPSDRPILSYRTDTGQGVYLRTVALPSLTSSGAGLLPMTLSRSGLGSAYDYDGVPVKVEVQMEAVPSEYLPAPFAATDFDAEGSWSFDPDTLAIVASGDNRTQQTVNLSYEVESQVPSPSREEVQQAGAGTGLDPVTREVPELSADIINLTKDVVSGASTAGEKALAIQRFLRSDAFTYTLEAPNSMGSDAISSFLLQERAGYCIHFAAAMMTMARVEGIDARMAVGFVPGERQEDGSYQVTSHDAHAWPELYLDGLGWVAFEPTPAYQGDPEYVDPSAMQPTATPSPSPTPTAAPTAQPTFVPPTAEPTPTGPTTTVDTDEGIGPVGTGVLIGLGILLLLALPALIRLGLRTVRLRGRQEAEAAADAAWTELRASFLDHDRPWPDGSPGPVGREVAETLTPDGAAALRQAAATVERSRFAREGASTAELPAQVREVRKSLAAGATIGGRWKAIFLPASLFRLNR